ncbi:MAG: outer membrane lipoprotein carrier protein LolA [Spirochaetes bacterium]|nr:MAG: outer membrane lipoprotein carrier protein LolA [Spirochaetota bacterium]
MKRLSPVLLFCALIVAGPLAQDIVTADQFFQKVSDTYVKIADYEANMAISTDTQPMQGKLYFKAPALLRIDFSQPPEQVIVFDGERLLVYIPQFRAVLKQDTGGVGVGATAAALASREGLAMMKRNYSIAWESTPSPMPLDANSKESVYRLLLSRKTISEGFKTIRISVSETTLYIRRIEGWTVANERIAFDFTAIKINQNIPANRFLYDAPASANVYNNFLFQ